MMPQKRVPNHLQIWIDARKKFHLSHAQVQMAREKSGKVILTFVSDDEGGGEWVEGEGWLSSLISVRAELARGDRRSLYLGWLLCAQSGELDDEDFEPPVPPGLGQLSACLESLAEFLRIDKDLLDIAALENHPLVDVREKQAEIRKWVSNLKFINVIGPKLRSS